MSSIEGLEGRLPALHIRLLGQFAVEVDGKAVPTTAWRGRKARALVKLLALAPASSLARDQLLDRLWPESDPEAAAVNLYSALTAARRALAPATIKLRGGVATLAAPGPITTDVALFERLAAAARVDSEPHAHEAALALYGGELLPEDRYEDWAIAPREALRATYQGLLRDSAALHEARGALIEARGALERLVADEPTDEAAHAALMRLHAAAGNRAAALRQYAALRDALARDLDAEPGPELRRLHATIIAEPPAVAAPARPVAATTPAALPGPLTSFVGREDDLAAVHALLAEGSVRLVSLTGIGGSGKTRLALALVHDRTTAAPTAAAFVELAGLPPTTDPRAETVAEAIAAALGVREHPGTTLVNAVALALRPRDFLLVLDNCEHVVEAVATLAAELLATCPRLHILVTSREALRLPGEVVWVVAPLAVPPLSATVVGTATDLAALALNPSLRLFLDRARQRQPGFALSAENAPALSAICRRLDGLPLAIELAASRIGLLGVAELAARLDDALATLATRDRGVPARQQTLRATLDWSFGLLADTERAFFRGLAVFAGSWSLAAAEAVVAPEESAAALPILEGLIDKSLVSAVADGPVTRYRFLEPVRQYAHARLVAAGEDTELRARHAAYYRAFVVGAEEGMGSPARRDWLVRLDPEVDNLRAAWNWYEEAAAAGPSLELCAALWRFWSARGWYDEWRHWFATALALADRSPVAASDDVLLGALFGGGFMARKVGDYATATALLERVLALSRARQRPRFLAGALTQLAMSLLRRGDADTARSYHAEALALRRARHDRWGESTSLNGLATVAHSLGDTATARAQLLEALAIERELGDSWQMAATLRRISALLLEDGEFAAARGLLEEALAHAHTSADQSAVVGCLTKLGELALLEGDGRAAADYLREATTTIDRTGLWGAEFADLLRAHAALATARDDHRRALRLAGAAAAIDAPLGEFAPPAATPAGHGESAQSRNTLGPAASTAAWAEGLTLSSDDALAEARALTLP